MKYLWYLLGLAVFMKLFPTAENVQEKKHEALLRQANDSLVVSPLNKKVYHDDYPEQFDLVSTDYSGNNENQWFLLQ